MSSNGTRLGVVSSSVLVRYVQFLLNIPYKTSLSNMHVFLSCSLFHITDLPRSGVQESVPMREGVRHALQEIAARYRSLLSTHDLSKVLATVVLTECQVHLLPSGCLNHFSATQKQLLFSMIV